MIGIIIPAVKGYVTPFDPDEAFDPSTHIASEEAFIQLLANGVYDEKYIGYKVQLSNSVSYDGGIWVIADVNHDSTNTGQTDCYDLISQDCFQGGSSYTFGSSNVWRNSSIRTWLNSTFYDGFSSNFKNRLINLKYQSRTTWYTDDYIIIPSFTEVKFGSDSYVYYEGLRYSIFTDSTSRIKYKSGTNDASYWWLRSECTYSGSEVWYVYNSGNKATQRPNGYGLLAPIIRVQ